MAHNEITVHEAPERVFAVLSDPRSFARWVVGSSEIRRADSSWPAIGTAFDHKVGIWPITLSDSSEVVEVDMPYLLKLLVKARPFNKAYVTLRLRRVAAGTRLEMDEVAADARSLLFFNPLTDPLVRMRNRESLRRLKALAERREPIPEGELPPRDSVHEGHVKGSSGPAAAEGFS
jgi:Polyketide cyclase / dehydrase and lipid transport